ncbi:hypothetical protein [Bacillus sp. RO1]|nr:hypothetical protein [Bacillus sp. RO1]
MSKLFRTPEDIMRKKKRNKVLGYSSLMVVVPLFAVVLTYLLNEI